MSIYTRICRQFYVFRTSSAPYISGDTLRSIIPQRVEGRNPDFRRATGPIVFCEGDHVERYLEYRRSTGGTPFVFISGNGDQNFGDAAADLMPETLIHWYGQNLLLKHEKATPLPIGLENRYYRNSGVVGRIERIKRMKLEKKNRIFFSFNIATNRAERESAMKEITAHPLGLGNESRIPVSRFQLLMAACKYTLSPPGNGFDCHRTWEAMYLETIPIVKKSHWSDYFQGLGLPMLALEDWRELRSMDEAFLDGFYESNRARFQAAPLFISYWKDRIRSSATLVV